MTPDTIEQFARTVFKTMQDCSKKIIYSKDENSFSPADLSFISPKFKTIKSATDFIALINDESSMHFQGYNREIMTSFCQSATLEQCRHLYDKKEWLSKLKFSIWLEMLSDAATENPELYFKILENRHISYPSVIKQYDLNELVSNSILNVGSGKTVEMLIDFFQKIPLDSINQIAIKKVLCSTLKEQHLQLFRFIPEFEEMYDMKKSYIIDSEDKQFFILINGYKCKNNFSIERIDEFQKILSLFSSRLENVTQTQINNIVIEHKEDNGTYIQTQITVRTDENALLDKNSFIKMFDNYMKHYQKNAIEADEIHVFDIDDWISKYMFSLELNNNLSHKPDTMKKLKI